MTDTPTPLDLAHAAMQDAPDEDAARLRFFDRLADAELFLLLAAEAAGGTAEPEMFEVGEGRFVLAFDREERLTAFTGRPSAYAALSGRAIAARLAGEGIGLALNLGAPSETLLPPDAIDWLADLLSGGPDLAEARIEAVHSPAGLPETLLPALDAKLATAAGMASAAWLAGVTYEGGQRSHLLAFIDAAPGAEAALARAVSEALVFSGLEAGVLDVAFFAEGSPASAGIARVGLRFDLPVPPAAEGPAAPGSDPARPPRLR